MKIAESLRGEPYYFSADKEYYEKGYRAVVGVPGRVLQARELTSLSMYPIYAMNDVTAEMFKEGVIQGFSSSEDSKLTTSAIIGTTTEGESLSDFHIYNIANDGTETLVEVDISKLVPEEIEENTTASEEEEAITLDSNATTVKVYEHNGEDGWPLSIL